MNEVKLLGAALVVLAACGSKKPKTQGNVTGVHVACATAPMHGRFDCASTLRDFLRANADARIAGVNVIYGAEGDELLVWQTDSDAWPKASTLEVDSHDCSPVTGNDPDCSTAIDDLTSAKPSKHHYFIVPVFEAPNKPANPGSWSFLDVRSARAGTPLDVGWDSVHTELVACRLEPGEPYLHDFGEGVMHAEGVGSDEGRTRRTAGEYPFLCEPALINYLRAHSDQRIAGVVALDGVVTTRVGDKDELGDPGTVTLMVLVGSPSTPSAGSLSIGEIACTAGSCGSYFAEFRPKVKVSPRILFTLPIGDSNLDQPTTGNLMIVSVVE